MNRNVRPLSNSDIKLVINYFHNSSESFLSGMGVDPNKLPAKDDWHTLLKNDHLKPLSDRSFHYLIWELDQQPIGHSNINKISFGQEAYMHLHLWHPNLRTRGNGLYFIQQCIAIYFELFALKDLYCEPYAENAAPNRTLKKAGFEFIKTYHTVPGWINLPQQVNRWHLSREQWLTSQS